MRPTRATPIPRIWCERPEQVDIGLLFVERTWSVRMRIRTRQARRPDRPGAVRHGRDGTGAQHEASASRCRRALAVGALGGGYLR
jgi:hypothetical protein